MNNPLRLGVNVDHVATVRQARGTTYPCPIEAARACIAAGAWGITMHLREDRRHIQEADVRALRALRTVPLNLEMATADDIMAIALDVRPDEVCLVPEKREELTTEGGLDVAGQFELVREAVATLSGAGIRVSLFVDPEPGQLDAARETGAPVVELHTGVYCDASPDDRPPELKRLVAGAERAHALGLQVNAGHGINLENLPGILSIPWLDTLNIGHSLVSRALALGLYAATREMIEAMNP